jgi:hypothetical protein
MQTLDLDTASAAIVTSVDESASSTVATHATPAPRRPVAADDNSTRNEHAKTAAADTILMTLQELSHDDEDVRLRNRLLYRISLTGAPALTTIIAADQQGALARNGLAELLPQMWRVKDAVGAPELNLFLRYFLHSPHAALRLSAAYGFLGVGDPAAVSDLQSASACEFSPVVRKQLDKVIRLLGG